MKKRNRRLGARLNHTERPFESLESRQMMAGDILMPSQLPASVRQTLFGRAEDLPAPGFHPKSAVVDTPQGGPTQLTQPPDIVLGEREDPSVPPAQRLSNSARLKAEPVPLGFDAGESDAIDLQGELIGINRPNDPPFNNAVTKERLQPPAAPSDDGSIPTANMVNLSPGSSVRLTGQIGDQRKGNTDSDFYALENLIAGQAISVHVEAENCDTCDFAVVVYNSVGRILAFNDDLGIFNGLGSGNSDSFLIFDVPRNGNYYLQVLGSVQGWTESIDPFDADGTQPNAGGGLYDISISLDDADLDYYSLNLQAGDILGVNSFGAANHVTLFDPAGNRLLTSGQDFGGLGYPVESLLPTGGVAALSYVIPASGTYFVRAAGFRPGDYELELRVFRSVLESGRRGEKQILFLDFNGADINPSVWSGASVLTRLSPLKQFMPGWGLTDENALINRIVEVVKENLVDDMKARGDNPNFQLEIRNSRDHADPYGQKNVSRVIVGGSIAELGISTIGIAQSIDVGNFNTEESAVVLLDLLSGPQTDPNSLSQFALAPGARKIDLVATGVGNIIAHEAGHFFGAWHTDQTNRFPNIMDQGGNLANHVGVGPDAVWGSRDDVDVDFITDDYVVNERFVGREDTLRLISMVLTTPIAPEEDADANGDGIFDRGFSGVVFRDANGDGTRQTSEAGVGGVRVYVDVNNDGEFGIGEPTTLTTVSGSYLLPPLGIGSHTIRIVAPFGQELTTPTSRIATASNAASSFDFGLKGTTSGTGIGIDFSDAPSSYGTASHQIQGALRLGAAVDGEAAATTNDGADDDGVVLSSLISGAAGSGTVTVSTGTASPAVLQGWIDFNRDGQFSSSEQIVKDLLAVAGSTTFTFTVPATAQAGASWARFRYGYERGVGPSGTSIAGEVEDYAVTIVASGGGGGGGTTPANAINDSLTANQGDTGITLNVLANDTVASGRTLIITSLGTPNQGGTAAISTDNKSVIYSPAASFSGTETFSYTVSDGVTTDSAIVSVNVQPSTNGNTPIVEFRATAVDSLGNPLTQVRVGDTFTLRVSTADLRTNGTGVFAAYVDVAFNAALASVSGQITFGTTFVNGKSGDVATPGLIDELGAFADNQTGTGQKIIATIPMVANSSGTVEFTTNPADNLPRNEVLIGDSASLAGRITYATSSLTILPVVAASAFTNPRNAYDVNDDGFVTARDALMVINEINANGSRPLAGAVPVSGRYLDVNGDRFLSARDVLLVINYLNRQAAAASGEPEVSTPAVSGPPATSSPAAVADAVFAELAPVKKSAKQLLV